MKIIYGEKQGKNLHTKGETEKKNFYEQLCKFYIMHMQTTHAFKIVMKLKEPF